MLTAARRLACSAGAALCAGLVCAGCGAGSQPASGGAGDLLKRPWPKRVTAAQAAPQPPQPKPATDPLAKVPLGRLVGQMVMAGMDGTWPSSDLLQEVRSGEIGGVLLFTQNVGSNLSGAIGALQQAAHQGGNPPLLISVDQEGGGVKRLSGPPTVPTRDIQSADVAMQQGQMTGQYLKGLGINVDLAPVSDIATSPDSFIATENRGFSGSPSQVASLVGGFATGVQNAGVAATGKHFPGVGALTVDTDNELSTVPSSRDEINTALTSFKQLVQDQVDMIMVASAIYPALDPNRPADFSPSVIGGLLRGQLNFQGVVITDALDSPDGLGGSAADRAQRAAKAGADIILFAPQDDGPPAFSGIFDAARQGLISRAQVEQSYSRITALKQTVAHG